MRAGEITLTNGAKIIFMENGICRITIDEMGIEQTLNPSHLVKTWKTVKNRAEIYVKHDLITSDDLDITPFELFGKYNNPARILRSFSL